MLDKELAQDSNLVAAAPSLAQRVQNTAPGERPPWESTAVVHQRHYLLVVVPSCAVLLEADLLWVVDAAVLCTESDQGTQRIRCALPSNRTGRKTLGLTLVLKLEGLKTVVVVETCSEENQILKIAIARSCS